MRRSGAVLVGSLLCVAWLNAVIIDRIAIVIDKDIIKDSDINRDLRVTAFLNEGPVDTSQAERKKVASHLVDQVFIRQEMRVGAYPTATIQNANEQLEALRKQRYKSAALYQAALQRYGITEPDLREQFRWQLSVLRFIDARFKPAVLVTDDEIDKYYQQHLVELHREHPKASLEDVRQEIRDTLVGQGVNKLFFAWLDQQRQQAKIRFLEEGLA